MNREPVRSPTRSVANEEFHGTYDHVNETSRAIVRALAEHCIAVCNSVAAFPMEMGQARIMMVQHKPVAVEAGLGRVGIHRNVIHPKFGSFILLGTILLAAAHRSKRCRSVRRLYALLSVLGLSGPEL